MKHAFLIIAHQHPEVLRALLTQLDHARSDIYLLIDAKQGALRESFKAYKPKAAGYCLLEPCVEVFWGDYSQVEAELRLFAAARAQGPYAYYHLLSGTDQLIKPVDALFAFLDAHQGTEFVSYWDSEAHRRDLRRKTAYYYPFTQHLKDKKTMVHRFTSPLRNICVALQKVTGMRRKSLYEMKKGSNWVSITQRFCDYLLEHEPQIRHTFHHTLCPDEIFLHTLLWNSPFREALGRWDSLEEGSLRKIDWERGSPYTFTLDDVEELRQSGAFFARKFDAPLPAGTF